MLETFSLYEFQIFGGNINPHHEWLYNYEIYTDGCPPYDDGVIKSDDYYDTEQEARFAAIGHITNLENPDA